jgi:hypothetical protein
MAKCTRQFLIPGLLILIIFQLACSGFFQVYWQKDNRWLLDARDVEVEWLSDADYQAALASNSSNHKTPDGRPYVVESGPNGSKSIVASGFQLVTPDGQWHGRITTRLATHATQMWLGVAIPVFIFSLLALLSLKGRSCRKGKEKPPAAELE